ncbi:MAG: hypothetical protein PV345_04370, partial [Wolbachia sp.]|nr:hypothetical protein [Wolbachia sp.]
LERVIKHDDPFKHSKAKQLRRHINSNSRIIYYVKYDITSSILSQDDCWIDDDVYGKRLDWRMFIQKLIGICSESNYDNSLGVSDCYTLACLNCLDEDTIRDLFKLCKEQAKKVHNLSEDEVLEESSRLLEKFWGHFITGKLEQIKEEYTECYDPNFDIYGFKVAYQDCEREAVAFFYKRLEKQNISEEVKLNLLIEAALYSMSGNNDVDTTIFCLQKVIGNKQHLEKFLSKCNVLYMLIDNGYFSIVCQLFPLRAQFFSLEDYSTLLSVISLESNKSRAELLHSIIELGKERFWRELPSFDCGSRSYLLREFAKNGCEEGFKELWQAYSSKERQHVFLSGKGEAVCGLLYIGGNQELLKEFLFYYANSNEMVLADIDNFIDDLDSAFNRYMPTADAHLDALNRDRIVFGKIKKTLPRLIEVLDQNTQDIQTSSVSVNINSTSAVQGNEEHMLSTMLSECFIFQQLQKQLI